MLVVLVVVAVLVVLVVVLIFGVVGRGACVWVSVEGALWLDE